MSSLLYVSPLRDNVSTLSWLRGLGRRERDKDSRTLLVPRTGLRTWDITEIIAESPVNSSHLYKVRFYASSLEVHSRCSLDP
jgi:hypothetical protein